MTVTGIAIAADASLEVRFEPGVVLRISGKANSITTGDVWWVATPVEDSRRPRTVDGPGDIGAR